MKRTFLTHAWIAVLLGSLLAGTALAQNAPGRQGRGYAAPPRSTEERAARREQCPNPELCPNPNRGQGPCLGEGPRGPRGQGQGGQGLGPRGQGHRRGLRDGTGPRSQDGTCPNLPAQPAR